MKRILFLPFPCFSSHAPLGSYLRYVDITILSDSIIVYHQFLFVDSAIGLLPTCRPCCSCWTRHFPRGLTSQTLFHWPLRKMVNRVGQVWAAVHTLDMSVPIANAIGWLKQESSGRKPNTSSIDIPYEVLPSSQ
jgi:hypothetical protein